MPRNNVKKSNKRSSKKTVRGKRGKSKKQNKNGLVMMFTVIAVIGAAAMLPTTLLLSIGMMPTIVAAYTSGKKRRKTRAMTIGAFNLAGCSPFLLDLWTKTHSLEASLRVVTDPGVIVVIFASAGIGYMFEWTVSNMVSGFLANKAERRKVAITKRQEELVDRWGQGVTGAVVKDANGFPINNEDVIGKEES